MNSERQENRTPPKEGGRTEGRVEAIKDQNIFILASLTFNHLFILSFNLCSGGYSLAFDL